MDAATAEYFWNVLLTNLIYPTKVDLDDQLSRMFSESIDLPRGIDEKLNLYFITRDNKHLVEAAIEAAGSFRLVREKPENHLILVAFLLNKNFISATEACALSQIDSSHFPLMSEDAIDLVRLAETVAEEQRMGFKNAGSDNFLESNLLEFSRLKGISFA